MPGVLIAFEGLDQSGKQTQAELLRDRLKEDGRKARLVSFPDYGTSIGEEIARALQGEREYGADVMQLLYVANRYERKPDLVRWLDGGLILVCDGKRLAGRRRRASERDDRGRRLRRRAGAPAVRSESGRSGVGPRRVVTRFGAASATRTCGRRRVRPSTRGLRRRPRP